MPVANHDIRLAGSVRHGMTVYQRHLAEAACQGIQRIGNQLMVGPIHFIDSSIELGPVDPAPPQRAMPKCPGRDEAEAVARARTDRCGADTFDNRRIDFLLASIAIDNGTRNILDNRAESGRDRTPAEPIYQRILKHLQCLTTLSGISQGRLVIGAPGMRDRKQEWKGSARRMNGWGRIGAHVQQARP